MMTPRLTDPELLTWLARMRAEQPLWDSLIAATPEEEFDFDEFADVRVGTDIALRQVEFYGPERLPVLGVRSRDTPLG